MSGKFARLDKETGLRVLCWRPRCPGELARVSEEPWVAAVGFPSVGLRPVEYTSPPRRRLNLGPGLREDADGRYVYTKYARVRMDKGREPANRRPIPRQLDGKLTQARHSIRLPAEVECRRCGDFSILHAERLGVSSSA
jgi:hypothetical protein